MVCPVGADWQRQIPGEGHLTAPLERRNEPAPKKEWGRPREALQLFPDGLTKLYEMMNEGRIRSRKVDGMRLVHLGDAANPK